MILEDIQWENSDAKEYLADMGGSKSGAHAFLQDTQPELHDHLPPNTHYLAPGEDVKKFLDKVSFRNQVVVRGCHALDVTGMVDVVPTEVGVSGREQVRKAIASVLESARSDDVKSYMEYESGMPFDGEIGILVQDYCKGVRGSIIEHPHERGIFRIGSEYDGEVDEMVCDEQGRQFKLFGKIEKRGIREVKDDFWGARTRAQEVIDFYRMVQESGLMPETHSFQMEFGKEQKTGKLRFFQARLFKPFEPFADFDALEQFSGDAGVSITNEFGVFGITPPEGSAVMYRAELDREFVDRWRNKENVAYAYNNYGHHEVTALDVQPRNMAAYLPYQPVSVLEHGHFRWMQKAPLSLIGLGRKIPGKDWMPGPDLIQNISDVVKLRIVSDGFCGVIRFEE